MEMGRLAPAWGRAPSRLGGAIAGGDDNGWCAGVAADSVAWVVAAWVRWVEGRTGGWILGMLGLATGGGEDAGTRRCRPGAGRDVG